MVSAAVVLALALLLPMPGPSEGCADVHIIGVRGSGQSGFGEQVSGVVEELTKGARAEGIATTTEALDYPAISVSDSLGLVLFTGEYDQSVQLGATALRTALADLGVGCPTTDVVLVGYSQGAQVIKAAFDDAAPRNRIAGVVLLADPTRDPDQMGVRRLGDPSTDRIGAFGSIPIPSHLRPVTFDVCARGDGVCERGRRSLTAHLDGYRGTPSIVAPLVLERLIDGRLRILRPR